MSHLRSGRFPTKSEYPVAASLPWLPQDILAVISIDLGPQDLYNLSITNKSLRIFLTSRSNAAPIWRRAFEEAVADGSLPPPWPYMTCEIQWAQLVFGGFCSICLVDLRGPVPGTDILWELNARYCHSCLPFQVQKRLPKELEKGIVRSYWWNLFPHASQSGTQIPMYSSEEIRKFTEEFTSCSSFEEREACLNQLHPRTLAVNKHALACAEWQATLPIVKGASPPTVACPDIRDTPSAREWFVRRLARLPWYRTAVLSNEPWL
ncbi:hypothetical protein C8F04DRAFT_105506 [Mycena alexandri]|uniref:F-box domain-containing protein n=1 Tax=Mycena alexandri TaxID=1745969 RepID=A0AAD6WTJ1_9AGAR|nr:hypothetical protein C8F04DRAFT_105506 [Mycena alexandri]